MFFPHGIGVCRVGVGVGRPLALDAAARSFVRLMAPKQQGVAAWSGGPTAGRARRFFARDVRATSGKGSPTSFVPCSDVHIAVCAPMKGRLCHRNLDPAFYQLAAATVAVVGHCASCFNHHLWQEATRGVVGDALEAVVNLA